MTDVMESGSRVRFVLLNLEGTSELAFSLAECFLWNTWIGLSGGLGVGKTELVRSLTAALGSKDAVSSPSYVLENVYEVCSVSAKPSKFIHHWDFYRLSSDYSDGDLLDQKEDENSLVLVEWPEKVPWLADLIDVYIQLSFVDKSDSNLVQEINQRGYDVEMSRVFELNVVEDMVKIGTFKELSSVLGACNNIMAVYSRETRGR